MTFPSPSASSSQPAAFTETPRAYPAYVCIKPPRRGLVWAPATPIMNPSKQELQKAVEVSKANITTKGQEFEKVVTRLNFAQDAFRRQSPEVIRHAQDCQRVLGRDVVPRNLFDEVQRAEASILWTERSLRSLEFKLRRDEKELAGKEESE